MKDTIQTARAHHLIGGETVEGERAAPVKNPADTTRTVGHVSIGSEDDVDRAAEVAHTAWRTWRTDAPSDRARRLRAAADLVAIREVELATLLTCEQGKPYPEALLEIRGSGRILSYYARLADLLDNDTVVRTDESVTALEGLRPLGVTGVIVPWNSPVYLAMLGIAPALLAGNSVIVKPSEYAPLALTGFLREVASVLPPGVLNVVQGDAVVGAAIAGHPTIRKIFFTGSAAAGQSVLAAGSATLKRVSLELGGNDPAIVLSDTVFDASFFREMVLGVFTLSGQVCFNVKRIYVDRTRYAEFLTRFTQAINEHISVGDGMKAGTTMGPVTTAAQYAKVRDIIADARSHGADVRELGTWNGSVDENRGYFIRPHVVTDVPHDSRVVMEEQFGPVVPVMAFDTIEEAVELANATQFGLAASIWTRDTALARDLARGIEAGSIFINAHRIGASAVDMTFGGFKQSGLGRGHGVAALRACSEIQLIADWADPASIPAPY